MRLTLSIISGQVGGVQRGLSHTFGPEGGIIGRNAACDWRIEDATRTVSGRHATITFRDGHFYVTDTSTNGLYVDGSFEPLGRGRSAEIAEGTRLRFGDYVVAAALSDDMSPTEDRAAPRISITPGAPSGLSTDPLDILGDTFGSEELSMTPERRQPATVRTSAPRAAGGRGRPKDDTLGSFFGASASSSKDDPFADLGSSGSAGRDTGRVGEDWMGHEAARPAAEARTTVAPVQEAPSPAARAPAPPQAAPRPARAAEGRAAASPDIRSRLSDALASELGDGGAEPVRRPVRQAPSAPTEVPAAAPPSSSAPEPAAALPPDLSWEDLLGDPDPVSGPSLAPASPPAGGVAQPEQPLPPMEDLLGGPAIAADMPAQQAAQPQAAGAPDAGATQARRPRREPGNNLLSDLVSPATRRSAGAKAAGNPLDPVSVLSERASHRASMTQFAAEPAAVTPTPAAAPQTAAPTTAAFDAVLRAAGIDPAGVPADQREEAACEIARTARAAAAGMTDVLAARRLFKEEFRLDRTRVQPEHNNPFKFHPSGDEALAKSIGGRETGFMGPGEAMTEGFMDVKAHEMAAMAALQNVIGTLLAQLDPASIQAEDAAGGFFGRGDGKALWERYKELHAGLAQDPEATARSIVSNEFRRAYDKTIATMRAKDKSR